MKSIIITATIISAAATLHAQEAWTYKDCVEYAKEHNISLKQSVLAEQTGHSTLEASKAQWVPSLDFATTQGFTNAPFNDTGNKNTYNSTYGLNASWTVWNGGERSNTIKRDEIQTRIYALATNDIERSLETEILQLYLNILYSREAIGINEEAAAVSAAQADRARQLMESGRLSRVDYAQLQAQAEQDNYAVVNSRGTYDTQRMQLKKLLELGLSQQLEVVSIEFSDEDVLAPLPPIEESYQMALATDTQLRGDELSVESAALDEKIAKAGYYPDISLSAGVGTSYMSGGNSFGEQIKRSLNESIGLTVSVPILNNKRTKTAVTKANIQRMNAQLDIESRQNEISQTIEGLYIDLKAAQARYISGLEQVKSTSLSAELVGEQFNLGLVNTVELLTAHNSSLQAQRELLQAKYMAMLDHKLIEFYRTAEVSL